MYRKIYSEDTPENRSAFINSWTTTYCRMQKEINYEISVKTLAINFSRCYFPISLEDMVSIFVKSGFTTDRKENNVYINIDSESAAIKEFKQGWN